MGLKKHPSTVQLPGGVRLSGVRFRVTEYDVERRPKTFEILPAGDVSEGPDHWTLYASEEHIRAPRREPTG